LSGLIASLSKVATFVLMTEAGAELGFLLFAQSEKGWPRAGASDCIFTDFPRDPALWTDPHGRFVLDHKQREWTAQTARSDKEMRIRLDLEDGWRFELHARKGESRWTAQREAEATCLSGMARRLPPKAPGP
jgi:hypothetical protein